MGEALIYSDRPGALPASYSFAPGLDARLYSVSAQFDGSGASGPFLACLSVYSQDDKLIGRFFPGSSVAAGDVAEVTFAPFLGGGGAGGLNRSIPVRLNTPDAAGNGYPILTSLNGFTAVRRVVAGFTQSVDGTWEGSLEIPDDYASDGRVVLTWAANAAAGNLRHRVGSAVVADGVSLDTAYTQEAYVNTTVPGTARFRFQTSFALSTSMIAGSTLNLKVTRNGSSGSDTLAAAAMLFGCDFYYTAGS